MASVQRQGDFNSLGGIILNGDPSVLVNGRPIAVVNSSVSPHPPCPKKYKHCVALTDGGSLTVRAGGQAIIMQGDTDTCGDSRIGGSDDVFIGSGGL